MFLSKRRFIQFAGLSIANRILPAWARPVTKRNDAARNVIIVTFGGGVRYAETFTPEGRNIPRLVEMRPNGHFFKTCTPGCCRISTRQPAS